jgi:hypothetical protein
VQLGAGRTENEVRLRALGSRLYIIGGTLGISSYDLDHPGNSWQPMTGAIASDAVVSNAFVGKNHILLLTEPQGANMVMGNPPMAPQQWQLIRQRQLMLNRNRMLPPQPGAANHAGPSLGIYAFARYPSASGTESGRCDFTPLAQPSCAISEPTAIESAEGIDGGVCYLTADNKLHLLRGAAQ